MEYTPTRMEDGLQDKADQRFVAVYPPLNSQPIPFPRSSGIEPECNPKYLRKYNMLTGDIPQDQLDACLRKAAKNRESGRYNSAPIFDHIYFPLKGVHFISGSLVTFDSTVSHKYPNYPESYNNNMEYIPIKREDTKEEEARQFASLMLNVYFRDTIDKLVKNTPNDAELGYAIRDYVNKLK